MVKAFSLQRKQPPAPVPPKPVTPQQATANQTNGPAEHSQEQAILAFQQHHGNRQTGQLIQRLRAQHSTVSRRSVQRLFSLKPKEKKSQLDTYIDREQVQLEDAPLIANQLISQKDQLKQLLNTKPPPKSGGSSTPSESDEAPNLRDEVDLILKEENKGNVVEAIQGYFPREVWINGRSKCNTHDMKKSAIIANSSDYGRRFNVESFHGDAELVAGNRDWLPVMALVAKTPKADTVLVAKTRRKSSPKMASEIRERLSALPGGGTGQHRAGEPVCYALLQPEAEKRRS